MAFLTFRGGIHPYDGKDLSKNCPVEKYLPKGDLAICFRTDTLVCIRNRKGNREASDSSRRHGRCDHH